MAAVHNRQDVQTGHRREQPDHQAPEATARVGQRDVQEPALADNVVNMPPNADQPVVRPRPALYVCCLESMQSVSMMLKWACCCLCCSEDDFDATSSDEASSMPDDDSASSVPEDSKNPQAEDENGNDASNGGVTRTQKDSDSSSSAV